MASDAIADQVRSPLFTALKINPQLVMLWKLAPIPTAVVGIVVLAVMLICAIFAEHIASFDPDGMDFGDLLNMMTAAYWLHFGRDRFSRLIYGCQVALLVSLGAIGSFGSYWSSTSSATRFATF
ncbi:hypothetical protein [Bradyrhizobium sp. WSM471]|uniref:hypothetical protein n=1 Tax=Bradyrhizobium sp. WSM471 TaxID=319017 RepID=UPI00024D1DCF|nr:MULTISPECIES: hypothetical protein [Bradyrhizobium]EHR01083.1 hypothetical protein Bra471DRAFT_01761 [Bradyrhizobium sp. WSM471]UFW43147.1 hypothetical protein BcanWSM471_08640 [Bradyrhizobium canariense]